MNFFTAIQVCFSKYVTFSGRASRSEFLNYTLFIALLAVCAYIIDASLVGETFWSYDGWMGPGESILNILTLLPSCAVTIRRLHDIDKSGWWIVLGLTIVGLIPLIYWSLRASYKGKNDYGEDLSEMLGEGIFKPISKWYGYLIVPLVLLLLTFGSMVLILENSGTIPKTRVIQGDELKFSSRDILLENGLMNSSDKILYFYSNAFSFEESGQLMTDDKIITYLTNEDGKIEKYEMYLKNVSSIEMEEEGGFWSNSVYKIVGTDEANYEFLRLFLSVESGGNTEFINEIRKRMK